MDQALLADATEGATSGPTIAALPRGGTTAAASARQAAETVRLYAADWAAFLNWCRERRHATLPASPATVAAYLGSMSATLKHGALARRAAAIADRHRREGHPSPGMDPAVREVLRAARGASGTTSGVSAAVPGTPSRPTPVRRRPAPGLTQLARMAARCPGDLAGLRDRALLLLTGSGLGGERLLALDVEHVRFTRGGMELAMPAAGARTEEVVIVSRITALAACPVRALEHWLHGSDTRFGPVFRKVNRWGGVEHRRLRTDAMRRIWQRRAKTLRTSRRAEDAPT